MEKGKWKMQGAMRRGAAASRRAHGASCFFNSQFSILNFPSRARSAFTLVELLVVIVVILLAMGIVGPAVTSMWEQRLESQAQIAVAGAVRSVQMQARTHGERGLLFYLDGDVQRLAIIEPAKAVDDSTHSATITQPNVLADCFNVAGGMIYRVPPPYRVAPRTAALAPAESNWQADELNAASLTELSGTNERHPNFFTLMFGPDGRLRVGRDVVIHDPGERTGLPRRDPTREYYDRWANAVEFPRFIDPSTGNLRDSALDGMVAVEDSGGNVAINFPSVDGVLVYDGSVYREMPVADDGTTDPKDRRDFLADQGHPYYVSRLTGNIVHGTVGE